MSYLAYTNEQLLQRIAELESINHDLAEKNKILKELSASDSLTGIRNQRALIAFLKAQLNDECTKPLCLAMLDIDNFKKINDNKGHIYGNKVLYLVAEVIQQNIRETDIVGRYGGDEFMIIFTDTVITDALKVAERIRQAVENNLLIDGLQVTISGGVKQYAGENFIDLIHFADLNLYKAKAYGRNIIL